MSRSIIILFTIAIILCNTAISLAASSHHPAFAHPNKKRPQSALKWTPEDVGSWILQVTGSEQLASAFYDHNIHGDDLFHVQKEDLEDMGFRETLIGRKLFKEIEKLRSKETSLNAVDFWTFRQLHPRSAFVISLGLLLCPRFTVMFMFLFQYDLLLEPLFATPGTSIPFWISWIFAPHLQCAFYAMRFANKNPYIVYPFVIKSLFSTVVEISGHFSRYQFYKAAQLTGQPKSKIDELRLRIVSRPLGELTLCLAILAIGYISSLLLPMWAQFPVSCVVAMYHLFFDVGSLTTSFNDIMQCIHLEPWLAKVLKFDGADNAAANIPGSILKTSKRMSGASEESFADFKKPKMATASTISQQLNFASSPSPPRAHAASVIGGSPTRRRKLAGIVQSKIIDPMKVVSPSQ